MNKFIIRVLSKIKFLGYINVNGKIKVNGIKFNIPVLNKVGYENLSMSESWMIEILKIILPFENKGFVDVGVNVGQTLLKLRSVSSNVEYIGFEPNPACVHYVSRLIEKNNLEHVSIVPVGISDKTELGILNYFSSSSTDGSASMIAEFRLNHNIFKKSYIPLFDLNEIIKVIDLNSISVLKIDVEGAELEVLNSFYSIIKEHQPIILMEILPAGNQENIFRIKRQNEIQSMLLDISYSIYRVIKQDNVFLDLEEIINIGIHSDFNKCEYVMVPSIKKKKLETSLQDRRK